MTADAKPFDQVMAALRAGDQLAAREVFDRYVRRLVGLAAAKLPASIKSKEDEEDAVNSAFKSFFKGHKTGSFAPEDWDELGTLLTYLTLCKVDRRIRKYLTGKRDVRRETAPATDDDGNQSEFPAAAPDPTPVEEAMLADTVGELLNRLDPADREVVRLRLQGYTTGEIAEAIGKAERTVYRTLNEVRDHLRHLLKLDHPDV